MSNGNFKSKWKESIIGKKLFRETKLFWQETTEVMALIPIQDKLSAINFNGPFTPI
jgi:hypothetical protein